MADNFVANPGTGGNTFASDDIGGVQYPRSKIAWGVDGVAVDVSAAAPLPVAMSAASAGAALEVTQVSIADLQNTLNTINDTLLFMTASIVKKLPRLDSRERAIVQVSAADGSEMNSAYYGINTTYTSDPVSGRLVFRTMEPWNFADAGSARIYQQIIVS